MFNVVRKRNGGEEVRTARLEVERMPGLNRLRELLPMALRDLLPGFRVQLLDGFSPCFEVRHGKDSYVLLADLPGVREQDIELQVSSHRLHLSGRRAAVEPTQNVDALLLQERCYGSFTRVFEFAEEIDADRLTSELKDGVLTLVVPKRVEVAPKKIPVKKDERAKA